MGFIVRISAMSLLMSTLLGCPLMDSDEESGSSSETVQNADRELRRSPAPRGQSPTHRQTRRGAPLVERGTEATAPCDAANVVTSDGPGLVFRNISELQTPFALSQALSALSVNGGGTGTAGEQEALVQSMFDTFADTAMLNSISNTNVPLNPRLTEAAMDPATFIAQMEPLAVFNRLDLASSNGSTCGEQRITYALSNNPTPPVSNPIPGEFTLIFEARYPNPMQDPVNMMNGLMPTNTLADCQPLADFWLSVAQMTSDSDRAMALSELFFVGTTFNGVFLPPVVTVANYQSPMGQVRTNQFVESPWELREFRTDASGGAVVFIPDTLKGNPVTDLYNAASTYSIDNPGLRATFLNELSAQMDDLLNPEISGIVAPIDVLTSFEPGFPEQFSGFKSVSQGNVDNPATVASQDVRNLITAEINARLGVTIPANSTVNEDHVLNRLGAMTCGGCHQYSSNGSGVDISDTVQWPGIGATGAFVQVRNTGAADSALSDALLTTFLPKRRTFLLETWLCDDDIGGCTTDDDCDDGLICVEGECVEDTSGTDCEDDDDCDDGLICVNGACIDDNSSTGCMNDYDCEPGWSCVYGMCVENSSTSDCSTDADCPEGLICIDGACIEPVSGCDGDDVDTDGDGICDSDEIAGCTARSACNFNPDATDSDDSCVFARGPCESCENGGVVVNDIDGDGICNEDEIVGCMARSACNYEPTATDADDSCVFARGPCEICQNGAVVNTDLNGDGICDDEEIVGCMYREACNYDPLATVPDDESCVMPREPCEICVNGAVVNTDLDGDGDCEQDEIVGCMDEDACNFDPAATIADDSVCVFARGECEICKDGDVVNTDIDGDGECDEEIVGCMYREACNFNPSATIPDDESCLFASRPCESCVNGGVVTNDVDGDGICNDDEVSGCMARSACNYNPEATDADDSCVFARGPCETCENGEVVSTDIDGDGICDDSEIVGCMARSACNYNPNATDADDSCVFARGPCETCENGGVVVNDVDGDGICNDDEIAGCVARNACNYNPQATDADDSCEFPDEPCEVCVNGAVVSTDTNGNGDCEDDGEIVGCTDAKACNFNPLATESDDSCILPSDPCEECKDGAVVTNDADGDDICDDDEIAGCTDGDACNFNANATDADDASCVFADGDCEECHNGEVVDNDANGNGICDDDESSSSACADPIADIVGTDVVTGTHVGDDAELEGSCGGTGNEDVIRFEPDAAGKYCLNTKGSQALTYLHVRTSCEEAGTEIGCAEGLSQGGDTIVAQLEIDVQAADTYYIVVDSGQDADSWRLSVTAGPCPGGSSDEVSGCTNGDACNFDSNATVDDGSCVFANAADCEVCGDDGTVIVNDGNDDGICDGDEVFGCMNPDACNFDPSANMPTRNCVIANAAECEICGDDGTVVNNDLNNNDICDDVENECSAPDLTIQADTGISGDSSGNHADFQSTGCTGADLGAGAEEVIMFTAPDPGGQFCISTNGSEISTVLYVRTACEDPGTQLACDAGSQETPAAEVEITALARQTYFIFVDTPTGTPGGNWALSVSSGACGGIVIGGPRD